MLRAFWLRSACFLAGRIWLLRKVINPMDDLEIMDLLLDKMKKSKNNEVFLKLMNSGTMQ